MKQPGTRDELRDIPLFTHLTAKERRLVADDIVERRYRKGQFIFREGDPAESFHVLKEGAVKCVKCSADGKQVTMRVLMPGDLFCCDAAVFNGGTHPGCAQPLGDVSVLSLSKACYYDLLKRNPHAALEVIRYLGNRLSEAQENAKALALSPAEQRLAALLVNLADRVGVQASGRNSAGTRSGNAQGRTRGENGAGASGSLRLGVRLTRQDLANMTGLALETATRLMGRFKRNGLVSGTAKSLVILDLPRLRQLAAVIPQRSAE